ncbi:sodium channel protein Nach [Drosophila gunungcola]|uniref:sodium channel protein Nach n=1 Tax=Drosophila gunungcola TaxID=103775 RepID=UPI0022E12A92|nr:sodium channel protein Nach [Drosophila gunungcola]
MSRIVTAFNRTVVEYFRKTSLNGFGLLYFIRKRRVQRIFWFLFISFGIILAGYAVFEMILEFLSYSTVTDLSELKVAEDEMYLPELRICSGYRFSGRKIINYVQDIDNPNNKSQEYLLRKLSLLSGYFDSLSVESEEVSQYSLPDIKNITSLLLSLSPACETLIIKCKLQKISANCSELFILKATIQGNCCVLNRANLTGELSLFLDSSQEDAYPLNDNFPGFSLHIPSWLGRISINPGEMAAVQVEVMELQGNPQLRAYAIEKRGCYFSQEGESREKCLNECRIKATLINCQCVPYPFGLSEENFKLHCTLENINCLQLVEKNWSPAQCPQCFPLCNQLFYRLKKKVIGNLHPWRSELYIKFKTPHRQLYKTNILYHWYQVLSNIGGVLGICIGCSLISFFELIYFMVFRLWSNYLRQPEI